jgi:hypothetical protein
MTIPMMVKKIIWVFLIRKEGGRAGRGLMLPGSFAGGIGGERCLFWRGWWISGIKNY